LLHLLHREVALAQEVLILLIKALLVKRLLLRRCTCL
jgi:hypothetical protein